MFQNSDRGIDQFDNLADFKANFLRYVRANDEAETAPATTEASTASVPPQAPRDQTRCRFFFSARGCKRGAGCWFLHADEPAEPEAADESKSK